MKKEKFIQLLEGIKTYQSLICGLVYLITIALHFNNLVIPIVYSTTVLGFFALVYRVLVLPFTLISSSVGQVFFKEISELKNQNKDVSNVIWKE